MSSDDTQEQLERYRDEIDHLDEDMLEALGKRMKVVEKIAGLKKGKLEIEDKEREKKVSENWRRLAGYKGLRTDFVEKILDIVFSYSKSRQ